MANVPSFYASPRSQVAIISTANSARDGSGVLATCFTAGAEGSKVERIIVQAIGTTTNGMVRLFVHNGTSAFLWKEIPIVALTPSATVQAFRDEVDGSRPENILLLPSGWSLRAAPHNAESFNIVVIGGDA
ncbi:hypothetical protein [Afipia carboxidovorans]|uniref:hypothetical protein n=1 Tax=Afipia carboxidovorans TaxID=40137 RepID=UPI003092816D|nr:hypothetical protein CRBSH125_06100 [Afipia carboxidovorans]